MNQPIQPEVAEDILDALALMRGAIADRPALTASLQEMDADEARKVAFDLTRASVVLLHLFASETQDVLRIIDTAINEFRQRAAGENKEQP